ncbi:MAG TPA: hypothetical protein VHJ17_25870, partial [Thermomonospora sp.]|nr:hypothetical protein [Thermomonospora sp.]
RELFGVGWLMGGAAPAGYLGIDEESVIYFMVHWLGSFGPLPQALDLPVSGATPTLSSPETTREFLCDERRCDVRRPSRSHRGRSKRASA